jgi:hypothetical protein
MFLQLPLQNRTLIPHYPLQPYISDVDRDHSHTLIRRGGPEQAHAIRSKLTFLVSVIILLVISIVGVRPTPVYTFKTNA